MQNKNYLFRLNFHTQRSNNSRLSHHDKSEPASPMKQVKHTPQSPLIFETLKPPVMWPRARGKILKSNFKKKESPRVMPENGFQPKVYGIKDVKDFEKNAAKFQKIDVEVIHSRKNSGFPGRKSHRRIASLDATGTETQLECPFVDEDIWVKKIKMVPKRVSSRMSMDDSRTKKLKSLNSSELSFFPPKPMTSQSPRKAKKGAMRPWSPSKQEASPFALTSFQDLSSYLRVV